MMWHTYFSMLKFEKGWLSLALLMNQDNKQFMKTWVFFFRLRALQKRWLERRRRSFEAGIIMKQRGDKLLLKGSFRVLPSLHHLRRVSTQQGVPKDFYLPPSSSFAWCSNSTTYLVVVTNQTWAILRDFFSCSIIFCFPLIITRSPPPLLQALLK